MKRSLKTGSILIVGLITVNLFTACEKKEGPESVLPVNDSIAMGAGYVTDVYYSLTDGIVAEVPRANWDIAFSVDPQSSAILINEASGVELKAYPSQSSTLEEMWNENIDLTDYDNWDMLNNPDTTWADGAFGMNATGHPNYGWGNYNMASHNVEGSALYIIKTRSGVMMKIAIEVKYSMQQRYEFRFADLAGKAETAVDLDCSASNANFVYYSLDARTVIENREPDASTWDILFTKYTDNSINYNVTGVLSNINVLVAEKDGTTIDNVTWTEEDLSDDINIIGSDWKSFDMENMVYVVDEAKVFVVKDASERCFVLNFTAFDMTTGKAVFTKLEK
jgi:hypothetical protein